jgi:hypothetical protein
MLRTLVVLSCLLLLPLVAAAQDTTPPATITNLEVATGKSTMVVAWQNTGDDGTDGNAVSYEVRRSQSPISDRTSAQLVASGSAGASGTWTCTDYSGLGCNSPYYVAVFLQDDAGNWSGLNAVYTVTQDCNSSLEVICFNGLGGARRATGPDLVPPSA